MAAVVGKVKNMLFGNVYKTLFVVLTPAIFGGLYVLGKPYRDGFMHREIERGHLPKE
jgi:hypothetical protein